jgi:hypothetical protein
LYVTDFVGGGNCLSRRDDRAAGDHSGGGSGNRKVDIEPAVISRLNFGRVLLSSALAV